MPHPHRRRCRLGGMLTAAAGISMGALLWSAGARSQLYAPRPLAGSWSLQQQDRSFAPPPEYLRSPPPEFLLSPSSELLPTRAPAPAPAHRRRKAPRRLLPPRPRSTPQHREQVDAVLLPDREVLVLSAEPASAKGATCVFQGGASAPARALGRLPGPGRHAYLCVLPDSAQQPLQPPLLISSSSAAAAARAPAPAAGKLLDWNHTMVFDSALLQGGDLLVFAKGPSHSKGVIRTATADVQCIYRSARGGTESSFPAIASGQQVFRLLASFCSVGIACSSGCRCSLVGSCGCCCRISVFWSSRRTLKGPCHCSSSLVPGMPSQDMQLWTCSLLLFDCKNG